MCLEYRRAVVRYHESRAQPKDTPPFRDETPKGWGTRICGSLVNLGGASSGGGEEFGGALLAVAEDARKLWANEELVGDRTEWAERKFVFDFITERDAGLAVASRWAGVDGVAVSPVFEGAALLDVTEAFIPSEVFDESFPGNANGDEWQSAKADGNA